MGVFGPELAIPLAAVTKFVAPVLVVAYGWFIVPKVFAAAMLVTALLFWFGSYSDPKHRVDARVSWREQLAAMRDPNVWKYSQYYSIVFGGYVALALWMTQYYVGEYGLSLQLRRRERLRSRSPAACCAPSAAGCPTSGARTRSPGGCSG